MNYQQQYYLDNIEKRKTAEYREINRISAANWRANHREKSMISGAKARAKRANMPFDITAEDIHIPEVCPVLLIPLFFTVGVQTDNTPALDRIDNSLGYIKGNIAVISHKANRLKGNLTPDEISRMLDYANSRKN